MSAILPSLDSVWHSLDDFESVVYENANDALIGLCRSECPHHQELEQALFDGADPDSKDELGMTALMYTCKLNRPQIVEFLLPFVENVDVRNNNGQTALMIASSLGKHSIVDLLCNAGAEVNARDLAGNTSLMIAAKINDTRVVQRLLDAKAALDATDLKGDTVLHQVCRRGQVATAKFLLQLQLDVHATNNDGATAFAIACAAPYVELFLVKAFLERGAKTYTPSSSCLKNLILNSMPGNDFETIVSMLLRNQRDPNASYVRCLPRTKSSSVVRLLLAAGADVNTVDENGDTTLLRTLRAGDVDTALCLIDDWKADVSLSNKMGSQAIHETCHVATAKFGEVLAAVMGAGGDIHAKNKEGTDLFGLLRYSPEKRAIVEDYSSLHYILK